MLSRRNFITGSSVALVSAAAVSGRTAAAAIPEAPTMSSPAMQPPILPSNGQEYQPSVTLNGWQSGQPLPVALQNIGHVAKRGGPFAEGCAAKFAKGSATAG